LPPVPLPRIAPGGAVSFFLATWPCGAEEGVGKMNRARLTGGAKRDGAHWSAGGAGRFSHACGAAAAGRARCTAAGAQGRRVRRPHVGPAGGVCYSGPRRGEGPNVLAGREGLTGFYLFLFIFYILYILFYSIFQAQSTLPKSKK
jgi:hypothetical protein